MLVCVHTIPVGIVRTRTISAQTIGVDTICVETTSTHTIMQKYLISNSWGHRKIFPSFLKVIINSLLSKATDTTSSKYKHSLHKGSFLIIKRSTPSRMVLIIKPDRCKQTKIKKVLYNPFIRV